MIRVTRFAATTLMCLALLMIVVGCQSPTDPDNTLEVDDFLDMSVTPNPATADASTDGRTYRVVRGNNQPDDVLAYDWLTTFTVTATLNGKADDKDALEFPVDVTSITLVVKQASGGIVTAPAGGDTEHFYYVTEASTNRFAAANSSVNVKFDAWYDLPSLRKEALITVSLAFKDNDGTTFTKSYDVRVAP